MKDFPTPLDLTRLKVQPVSERTSLSPIETKLFNPATPPATLPAQQQQQLAGCVAKITDAQKRGASVILMYGAHLVKNGAHHIVIDLISRGWVTHLATNGAGTIHDWELAFLGRTEESVRANVATGTFGSWDETGRHAQLALMAGALRGEGYGRSLGRFIIEDGVGLPDTKTLENFLRDEPSHPLTPARAELLQAMVRFNLPSGRLDVKHPWKDTCIVGQAFRHNVPLTVHPGIGYDIIANHPMYNGAVVGRAAGIDYAQISRSIEGLDGGVLLSVGSAIMAPQIFEKSLSAVNNLRIQAGRPTVHDHSLYVVDLQDGGGWDWSHGEPPKDNPAYYLRFCKTYARMGGEMQYVQADNVAFLHNLANALK